MKQICALALLSVVFPLLIFALWYVVQFPEALEPEQNDMKGEVL